MHSICLITIFLFSVNATAISTECKNWFASSGISPNSKDCELQCSIADIDMSNFFCHNECGDLCQNHCGKPDSYWLSKMKTLIPPNWPNKSEKPKAWTDFEKKRVLAALKRYPENLWSDSIAGIYRMAKSVDYPVPASNDSHSIVLYDTSFGGLSDVTLDQVLAHEISHMVYVKMNEKTQHDFAVAADWKDPLHTGNFQPSRGQVMRESSLKSLTEDFAVNTEYLLFEPDNLKLKLPKINDWLRNYFGPHFKIDPGCPNEK